MFRIDRNLVNLAAPRSSDVDSEPTAADDEGEQQDVPDASASIEFAVQAALKKAEEIAEQIIAEARGEASALIEAAGEKIEKDRATARREGYKDGEKEGRTAYDAKMKEDDGKLIRVIDEVYSDKTRLYDEFEDKIVGLTLDIVRKIINPAEEELGGVFKSLIKNALKQIKLSEKIIIRVGPAEYERFFSAGSAVFELDSGMTATATVLRDLSLKEGDCIIDTSTETVNAGFDSQMKQIEIAFGR